MNLRLGLPVPFRGRNRVFDELKGFAILMVVLFHGSAVIGWKNLLHGEVGVDVFVILTGVGLALGSPLDSTWVFLKRRFFRIYPAYWFVLTLYLGVGLVLGRKIQGWDILVHYLGVHSWFGSRCALAINDSFWYVTLVTFLYILYPLVTKYVAKVDALLLFGALLSLGLCVLYSGDQYWVALFGFRLPGFFIGLIAGRLLRDGALDIPITPVLGGAALVFGYLSFSQNVFFITPVVGGSLILFFGLYLRQHLAVPFRSTLSYLGNRSLEIFLLHQPLIREYNVFVVFRDTHSNQLPSKTLLLLGVIVGFTFSLGVAEILHRLLSLFPTRRRPNPVVGGGYLAPTPCRSGP